MRRVLCFIVLACAFGYAKGNLVSELDGVAQQSASGTMCTSNSHCSPGYTCDNMGMCQESSDGGGNTCSSDADCSEGQTCSTTGCTGGTGGMGSSCTAGANGEACQNGGSATGTTGSCGCSCASGYSGANCQTAASCTAGANGAACQNGGSATGTTGNCGCSCASGFSGANCQTGGACSANSDCNTGEKCLTALQTPKCIKDCGTAGCEDWSEQQQHDSECSTKLANTVTQLDNCHCMAVCKGLNTWKETATSGDGSVGTAKWLAKVPSGILEASASSDWNTWMNYLGYVSNKKVTCTADSQCDGNGGETCKKAGSSCPSGATDCQCRMNSSNNNDPGVNSDKGEWVTKVCKTVCDAMDTSEKQGIRKFGIKDVHPSQMGSANGDFTMNPKGSVFSGTSGHSTYVPANAYVIAKGEVAETERVIQGVQGVLPNIPDSDVRKNKDFDVKAKFKVWTQSLKLLQCATTETNIKTCCSIPESTNDQGNNKYWGQENKNPTSQNGGSNFHNWNSAYSALKTPASGYKTYPNWANSQYFIKKKLSQTHTAKCWEEGACWPSYDPDVACTVSRKTFVFKICLTHLKVLASESGYTALGSNQQCYQPNHHSTPPQPFSDGLPGATTLNWNLNNPDSSSDRSPLTNGVTISAQKPSPNPNTFDGTHPIFKCTLGTSNDREGFCGTSKFASDTAWAEISGLVF